MPPLVSSRHPSIHPHWGFALILLIALCLIPLRLDAQQKHEVQPGETLYSISHLYGLSVDQLLAANPQVGETLYAGATLTIPAASAASSSSSTSSSTTSSASASSSSSSSKAAIPDPRQDGIGGCKRMYTVQKKETVYSISRRFGLTEDELRAANPQIKKNKVKKGELICIPFTAEELAAERRRRAEQQRQAEEEAKRLAAINVAVVLPFDLSAATLSAEAIKMLDFYEGFLLAVDELKQQGVSINVYAYEEKGAGEIAMQQVLQQPMLPSMNLIIGPMRADNIAPLADFATRRNIPLVVPFSTASGVCAAHPTTFQVNTPVASLYPKVYELFLNRFGGCRVVFIHSEEGAKQTAFVQGLQDALDQAGIGYETASAALLMEPEQFLEKLAPAQRNVLIPTSSAQTAFETLARRLGGIDELKNYQIALFGYPEWQTFSDTNKDRMRKWNTYFFATFQTNSTSADAQRFNRNFERWFKRSQYASYPLYGQHGYDVGRFFLQGINSYGSDFLSQQAALRVSALQLPMQFQRKASGSGFYNTTLRIVEM